MYICACRGHIEDSYVRIPKMIMASPPLPSVVASETTLPKVSNGHGYFGSEVLGLQQGWLQNANPVYIYYI